MLFTSYWLYRSLYKWSMSKKRTYNTQNPYRCTWQKEQVKHSLLRTKLDFGCRLQRVFLILGGEYIKSMHDEAKAVVLTVFSSYNVSALLQSFLSFIFLKSSSHSLLSCLCVSLSISSLLTVTTLTLWWHLVGYQVKKNPLSSCRNHSNHWDKNMTS